jgi:hypothetical protein
MCLIVACDKEIPLNLEFIADVIKKNDDGFGMMWVQDGAIKTFKMLNPKPQEVFNKVQEVNQYEPYLHFRMRTHGNTDLNNCHPYDCGNSIYLMHNGVLSHGNNADKTLSDTWHFINDILKPLFAQCKNPHELLRSPVFNSIIKHYIGYSNRLVFMDRGGPALINHDTWVEVKNPWTGVKGLLVSNSYAWNEYGFRDPKAPSHSTKGGNKQLHRGKDGKWTKNTTQDNVSPCYVSDRFSDKFEEYQDPYYLDEDWNVWEKKGRGFKRRFDLEWSDLSAFPPPANGNTTSLRDVVDSAVTPEMKCQPTTPPEQLNLPVLVTNGQYIPADKYGAYLKAAKDLVEQADKEEDEVATKVIDMQTGEVLSETKHPNEEEEGDADTTVIDTTKQVQQYQEAYLGVLLNTWKQYSLFDIDRRIAEQPEDAALVLKELLKGV